MDPMPDVIPDASLSTAFFPATAGADVTSAEVTPLLMPDSRAFLALSCIAGLPCVIPAETASVASCAFWPAGMETFALVIPLDS